METLIQVLDRLQQDRRLGPLHISLFLALILIWQEQGGHEVIYIGISKVIGRTRIASQKSYYRCLKDLDRCGYIGYRRNWDNKGKSEVTILPYPGNGFLFPKYR